MKIDRVLECLNYIFGLVSFIDNQNERKENVFLRMMMSLRVAFLGLFGFLFIRYLHKFKYLF